MTTKTPRIGSFSLCRGAEICEVPCKGEPGPTNTPSGLGVFLLVGVKRFELGTSRTRTVRSTGLSHTPFSVRHYTVANLVLASIMGLITLPGYTRRTSHRSDHRPGGSLDAPGGLRYLVGNCCFEQLGVELIQVENTQAHGLAIRINQFEDHWLKIERPDIPSYVQDSAGSCFFRHGAEHPDRFRWISRRVDLVIPEESSRTRTEFND